MSEANKKIRDLERALRREKANVNRAQSERDAALQELNKLRQPDLPLDIDAAFDEFIEFPEGSDGKCVTTVSAKLFARHCVGQMREENERLLFANRYNADMYRQIDDERKRLQAEVERLRADNDHQRERRNAARDAIEKGKAERRAIEQERDQLKATLQRFIELDQNDRDLPLELWAVQRDVSPVDISLALHDAEVIERETQRCIEAVEAEPEYPDEAPPELMKYINQCIENKDAAHMLHMMRHSVRLTKSEIINRIHGLETQQAKEVQS